MLTEREVVAGMAEDRGDQVALEPVETGCCIAPVHTEAMLEVAWGAGCRIGVVVVEEERHGLGPLSMENRQYGKLKHVVRRLRRVNGNRSSRSSRYKA